MGTWRIKPEPIEAPVAGEADVVVVGHGYAGITACREIAEQGHSVILLEKQYEDMFMVIGNENASVNGSYMLEVGLPEIDPIEYYNNWMLMAGYTPNPDLIMKFAQNSGSATDWYLDSVTHEELEKGVSVKFHGTGTFEPAMVDEGVYDHIITCLLYTSHMPRRQHSCLPQPTSPQSLPRTPRAARSRYPRRCLA